MHKVASGEKQQHKTKVEKMQSNEEKGTIKFGRGVVATAQPEKWLDSAQSRV